MALAPADPDELFIREWAARLDPDWQEAQAKRQEAAGHWFARAFHRGQLAEHAPWSAVAWANLEKACRQLGDFCPARATCDRLLQRDPTLAPVYLQRARISRLQGRTWREWLDLTRCVARGLREHPDWAKFAYASAAVANDAAGKADWGVAVREHSLAVLWAPHDPWHWHCLAWVRLAAKDEDGASDVCRLLDARFGDLQPNRDRFLLSVLLAQHAHPLLPGPLVAEQAVQRDAIRGAYVIASTACLLPHAPLEPAKLVSVAARAVTFDPASAAFRATYGACLYRAGKYAEAVKELEEAVPLNNQGGSVWQNLFLALGYHKLGQSEKSREHCDKVKLRADASWEERLIDERLRAELKKLQEASSKPAP
jgi:tetratricopeptide (TPR) repeat protein